MAIGKYKQEWISNVLTWLMSQIFCRGLAGSGFSEKIKNIFLKISRVTWGSIGVVCFVLMFLYWGDFDFPLFFLSVEVAWFIQVRSGWESILSVSRGGVYSDTRLAEGLEGCMLVFSFYFLFKESFLRKICFYVCLYEKFLSKLSFLKKARS